jgi:hypothetical protein
VLIAVVLGVVLVRSAIIVSYEAPPKQADGGLFRVVHRIARAIATNAYWMLGLCLVRVFDCYRRRRGAIGKPVGAGAIALSR